MMFSAVLKKLEIENIPEGLSEYWDESQNSFSGEAFYANDEHSAAIDQNQISHCSLPAVERENRLTKDLGGGEGGP